MQFYLEMEVNNINNNNRSLKQNSQSAGFEPARAEPNGFLVHRLNHSATTAWLLYPAMLINTSSDL